MEEIVRGHLEEERRWADDDAIPDPEVVLHQGVIPWKTEVRE